MSGVWPNPDGRCENQHYNPGIYWPKMDNLHFQATKRVIAQRAYSSWFTLCEGEMWSDPACRAEDMDLEERPVDWWKERSGGVKWNVQASSRMRPCVSHERRGMWEAAASGIVNKARYLVTAFVRSLRCFGGG